MFPKEHGLASPTTSTAKKTESIRVFNLAKELKLENKELLELCHNLGFEKKSQLSGLSTEEVVSIKAKLAAGTSKPSPGNTSSAKPAAPVMPIKAPDLKVKTLASNKPRSLSNVPVVEAAEPMVAEVEPQSEEAVVASEQQPTESVGPATPQATVPAAPSTPVRGLDNLLNPNRMPNLGARGMSSGMRNLSPQRSTPPAQPTRPMAIPPVDPAAAPSAPDAEAAPATEPVAQQVAEAAAPATAQAQQPKQQTAPPNNFGRPQQLTNSPRPGQSPGGYVQRPQGPGSNRPQSPGQQQPVQPPRGNFPPPNPGAPRPPLGGGGNQQQRGPAANAPKPAIPAANKSVKLTPDQIKKLREREQKLGQKLTTDQVTKTIISDTGSGPGGPADRGAAPAGGATRTPDRTGGPLARGPARPEDAAGEDGKRGGPGGAKGGSGVIGRDGRHAQRQSRDRRGSGPTDKGAVFIVGGQVEVNEQRSGSQKGPRAALLAKMKRRGQQQAVKKEGPVEINLPITVRTLSEAIGVKLGELSKQLLSETQQLYGASSIVDFDVAEVIAINKGITLVAKVQKSVKELLLEEFEIRANTVDPETLRPRPPIVVIMGHVDHGKTSLLDKIRQEYGLTSDVVSTETGGITQVLRAWRVEKDGKPVTFLDTPGHEAFTKMRARGANVTDIAVIVVAATDGVMPQTEEAIAHARAAEVDIIVAINKVDMPNANLDKTRRQLYQLNLLPDNMGGDIQFIETSAVTGQGIGDLLDAISIQVELSDPPLMADPAHPASGTCLEAYMDGDKGVMATLLVRQGTLRTGDVILCGASHGRVRAMFDDMGLTVDEAGPSTPVKVFGLNEVPDADDPFYFVDSVTRAAEIAEKERQLIREAELNKFTPVSLDRLREVNSKEKITELKIILKAEARGSVEAIKKELEKLVHAEIRCRVLLAGIGAISAADVTLALTSPADTLVIGFNVTADDEALRLSEERGISLQEYQIIYNLVDDVRAALEGRLKPIEEVVHLGRAVIRETFKVTKVGTVAGCYVTSGQIERSARVRVIREGTVIFPPAGKTLGLDNLKRFKDDAKEVREGFECGMKITGFDDVKVGDVIEAYRIDIKQRTL